MALAILANTPVWAWCILIGIVALGLRSTRSRQSPAQLIVALPAAMSIYSLFGVFTKFGLHAGPLAAWLVGMIAAFGANHFAFGAPQGALRNPDDDTIQIPGSWLPLFMMLGIYGINYSLGVMGAIHPDWIEEALIQFGTCAAFGVCSGLLVSRAVLSLRRSGLAA